MIQTAAPVDPKDRCALNVARRPRSDSSCHSARCIRTAASMSCKGCTTAVTWLRLISSVRRRSASAVTVPMASGSACSLRIDTALAERSEEHTSELQSLAYLVCRLLLEKKKKKNHKIILS